MIHIQKNLADFRSPYFLINREPDSTKSANTTATTRYVTPYCSVSVDKFFKALGLHLFDKM